MIRMKITAIAFRTMVAAACVFVAPGVSAHCDAMDGPVVMTAMEALKKGDVTPVLK